MKRGYVYTLLIVLGLCTASFFLVLPALADAGSCYDDSYSYLDDGDTARSVGDQYPLGTGIKINIASEISVNNVSFLVCEYSSDPFPAGTYIWAEIRDFNTWQQIATSTLYDTDMLLLVDNLAYCLPASEVHNFHFTYTDLPAGDYLIYLMVSQAGGRAYILNKNEDTAVDSVYEVDGGNPAELETVDAETPYFHLGAEYCDLISDKLTWQFPEDGGTYNNYEFNDWNLIYDMDAADLGDWNLLGVNYYDVNGKFYQDFESVTTTTEPTMWALDMTANLPNGIVNSQGFLVKITDCDNYWDDDCTWEDIAMTEFIDWTMIASSTYTIFDNPWHIATFTPASTSDESTEASGLISNIWTGVKRIFPFSIIFQVKDIATEINETSTTSVDISVADFLPAESAQYVGTGTVLSADLFDTALGTLWTDKVQKLLEWLVYGFFLVFWIFLIFPRLSKTK